MTSASQALEELLEVIETITSSRYALDRVALTDAVTAAAGVASPFGYPAAFSAVPFAYGLLAETAMYDEENLAYIAAGSVPSGWRGAAGENAVQGLESLTGYLLVIANIYFSANQAMETWAEKLTEAHRGDRHGQSDLFEALTAIADTQSRIKYAASPTSTADLIGGYRERELALEGCRLRLRAARAAEDAAADFIHTFTGLAEQARARSLRNAGIDPLAAVVAAYAPRGAVPTAVLVAGICSPAEITRAADVFTRLPATQQAEFESLLAGSNSPQEAAYLWKLLSAGPPVGAIADARRHLRQLDIDPVDIAGTSDDMGEAVLHPVEYRAIATSPTLSDQLRHLYAQGTRIEYSDLPDSILGEFHSRSHVPGLDDRILLDSEYKNNPGPDSVATLAHEVGHALDPDATRMNRPSWEWGESPSDYNEKMIRHGLELEARADLNIGIAHKESYETREDGIASIHDPLNAAIFEDYHAGTISEEEAVDRIADSKWEHEPFYKDYYGILPD
ncbi:hypothetical protein [Nocardia sp. CA-290969]|uniref:hypothetical protein n=1 Tax=Nocardia sp. CA-290969 TaxID=3239986 RepID=UPI003D94176B